MSASVLAPKPPGGFSSKTPGQSASPRNIHTGGAAPINTADGNNSTPVITEIYVAEMFVPFSTIVQGVAVFAGSVWSDNVKVGIFDAAGNLLAASASTAGSTTADVYQRFPIGFEFSSGAAVATTQIVLNPGTYYIGIILDGTTSRYNTFAVGNFGAGKITGAVYATALSTTSLTITPPSTFTTALGPIASLY